MRAGVSEILDAWERALPRRPAGRALVLLEATSGIDPDRLAQLSLGQRDRRLFALREALFGTELSSLAECPTCKATLEFACDTRDLAAAAPDEPEEPEEKEKEPPAAMAEGAGSGPAGPAGGARGRRLVHGEYEIDFRLLTSADVLSLRPSDDPAAARRRLLARCVLRAARAGQPMASGDLPPDVCAALVEALGKADEAADLRMSFTCAACGAAWETRFDIVRYLWSEIEAWAQRLLAEVHALALRYGWSERAILSMSPWRRQLYLGFGDS